MDRHETLQEKKKKKKKTGQAANETGNKVETRRPNLLDHFRNANTLHAKVHSPYIVSLKKMQHAAGTVLPYLDHEIQVKSGFR